MPDDNQPTSGKGMPSSNDQTPDISKDNDQYKINRDSAFLSNAKKPFKPWQIWYARYKSLDQKQRVILLLLAGVVLAGLLMLGMALFTKDAPAPAQVSISPKKEAPKPTTEPSRLTGLQISPELNKLPVTGIMIENSPEARPQAGLNEAGVIFEAIAEGGITRFLALYLEGQPDYIGPVRSVRPYYLDFLLPFDAAVAHAGGSAEALAQIRNQGIKDIDHGANAGAYQRVSNRFAPHNLYTSRAKLLEAHNARGYTSSAFTGWPRKEAENALTTPTARTIDFSISRALYNTHFDYDAASNSYLRSQGGRPHVDERSGAQLSLKVVIAIVANRSQNGIYSVYQTTGSGSLFVFQDGGFIEGTWEKADRKSMYAFKMPDGSILKLNPGKTWVTLITPGGVRHAP